MERAIYLIILLFLFETTKSQNKNDELIYNAYISGDMVEWKSCIDKMHKTKNKTNEFTLNLINYQIGYIGWCIGQEKEDEAQQYIDIAKKYINSLQKLNYKPSYLYSYDGAIDGLRIGLNVFLAPFIGSDIIEKAKLAIKLDPQNPYGYILYANSKYYMWAMMGGSKQTALNYYETAEKIIEKENKSHKNWNYLSLLTMIAHAHEEMDKLVLANTYYKKILRTEPEFSWVKNELYPEFLKKYKNEQ